MPHTARKVSKSGYYHVVPKGIADQLVFSTPQDRALYVDLLGDARDKAGVLLHAYCLMSNHVHLVVETQEMGRLADFMKYVSERYGTYYAHNLERTGGVFRKPFWSEPIETDAHLLCAVRYVHANPAAAGLCPASQYEWSSVQDYLGRPGITETSMVLEMVGGRRGFIDFSKADNSTLTPFPGSTLRSHLSDEEALRIARSILRDTGVNLSAFPPNQRREAVQLLAERGFTPHQISRICGIGRGQVNHYLA